MSPAESLDDFRYMRAAIYIALTFLISNVTFAGELSAATLSEQKRSPHRLGYQVMPGCHAHIHQQRSCNRHDMLTYTIKTTIYMYTSERRLSICEFEVTLRVLLILLIRYPGF